MFWVHLKNMKLNSKVKALVHDHFYNDHCIIFLMMTHHHWKNDTDLHDQFFNDHYNSGQWSLKNWWMITRSFLMTTWIHPRGGGTQYILPTACAALKGVFFRRPKNTVRVKIYKINVRVSFFREKITVRVTFSPQW